MPIMSSVSRWARAIVGGVPLLDHEELTTLGGGDEQVDVAASRLAAGQHDVSGEHRREVGLALGPSGERGGEDRDFDVSRHGSVPSPERAWQPVAQ